MLRTTLSTSSPLRSPTISNSMLPSIRCQSLNWPLFDLQFNTALYSISISMLPSIRCPPLKWPLFNLQFNIALYLISSSTLPFIESIRSHYSKQMSSQTVVKYHEAHHGHFFTSFYIYTIKTCWHSDGARSYTFVTAFFFLMVMSVV